MRKTVLHIIFAVFLVSSFGVFQVNTVLADTINYPVTGGEIIFDATTGSITGFTGNPTDVVVPNLINGIIVNSIEDSAFLHCVSTLNITIPYCVQYISDRAFFYCINLKNINVDSNNAIYYSIEGILFDNEDNNEHGLVCYPAGRDGNIVIPDNITFIYSYAFAFCANLKTIYIPRNIAFINPYAFYNCKLCSAYFLGNAPGMGSYAFCNNSINAPDFKIYYTQFARGFSTPRWKEYNTVLFTPQSYVNYPVEGGEIVFDTDIASVIGFTGSPSIVNIPSLINGVNVTNIGDYSFQSCLSLTDISISKGVIHIGNSAFADCPYLANINLPDSVKSIAGGAFWNCSSLNDITIPNSVTSMGEGVFYYCTNLTFVKMSNNISCIENGTFINCTSLKQIIIPQGVTSIGNSAFDNCQSLKSINIPFGVKSIGEWSFYRCGIQNIILPDTLINIEKGAFNYAGLTNVSIPSSVKSIGTDAFWWCTSLKSAFFCGDAPSMGFCVFDNTSPEFKIYYKQNSTGFSTPTWDNYPCEMQAPQYFTESITQNTLQRKDGCILGDVTINVCNNSKSVRVCKIVNAIYSSSRLIKTIIKDVTLDDGDNAIDFSNMNITNTSQDECRFKVMVLDTLSDLIPLSESVTGLVQ